jgi:hypothetical protein
MAALIIRDLSPRLHARLSLEARKNHRSMSKQVVSLLELALQPQVPFLNIKDLPEPLKPAKPMTDAFLRKAVREGRA